jgi:hypothetical protein
MIVDACPPCPACTLYALRDQHPLRAKVRWAVGPAIYPHNKCESRPSATRHSRNDSGGVLRVAGKFWGLSATRWPRRPKAHPASPWGRLGSWGAVEGILRSVGRPRRTNGPPIACGGPSVWVEQSRKFCLSVRTAGGIRNQQAAKGVAETTGRSGSKGCRRPAFTQIFFGLRPSHNSHPCPLHVVDVRASFEPIIGVHQ